MRLSILVLALVACSPDSSPPAARPDARSTIPRDPVGTFELTGTFEVPIPRAAAEVIDLLRAATDSPDDPSRYLLDRVVAALPDGAVKTLAQHATPLVAAYLNDRLTEIAPRFVVGIDAIANGFARIAGRFGTIEVLRVAGDGSAVRALVGARFELGSTPREVAFEPFGVADAAARTQVTLERDGQLAIADHVLAVDYSALLRLGLDHAVIPSVDPAATDLAIALRDLIDCAKLGEMMAEHVGAGSPALYRAACTAGMIAAADELYARIAAIGGAPFRLEAAGAATGVDADGDGSMDAIHGGSWIGTFGTTGALDALGPSTFIGARTPD